MSKLVLTESDLSIIENALTGLAAACRDDARNHQDELFREAATQAADRYDALALQIGKADVIEVERS